MAHIKRFDNVGITVADLAKDIIRDPTERAGRISS
jgi:hypothetical protein